MISSGKRKTTVAVFMGGHDKQILAEVRTIAGELWRGEGPTGLQHLRDQSSLGGGRADKASYRSQGRKRLQKSEISSMR